jgi:hypothetical protein
MLGKPVIGQYLITVELIAFLATFFARREICRALGSQA